MFMKVQVSSIWKKKTVMINSRIRTCDTQDPVQVYHANLQTTDD